MNSPVRRNLRDLEQTRRLGVILAEALAATPVPLLVQGRLGAGKTTLIRFLVEALPGGEEAEVSSPSFTLCNIYPTRPEVRHVDLYRLPEGRMDEDLLELLEDRECLLLLEWPEKLPPALLPPSWLSCRLTERQNDRRAVLEARGAPAALALERLRAALRVPPSRPLPPEDPRRGIR